MATRCGAIDPGVLLHLMRVQGMSAEALEDMLYHSSGLLGLSGVSGDARVLVESDAPAADEALDIFAFRVAREAAALAATLGGIDALVFTGGIGEHQPEIRARICARLRWLGVTIDAQLNSANAPDIALSGARVAVLIISADEERRWPRSAVHSWRPLDQSPRSQPGHSRGAFGSAGRRRFVERSKVLRVTLERVRVFPSLLGRLHPRAI
jgi:acetate kinase